MIETEKHNTVDEILARHAVEFSEFQKLTDTQKARFQVQQRARYETDPWAFLSDCVFTLDQVSEGNSAIKPYPSDLAYCELLTRIWQREHLIAIPKSRRMICSWTFIALNTWYGIFNIGRNIGFVSKKEDDSGELIERAEFIIKHIPEWRIPASTLPKIENGKMTKQPPALTFPEINSKIQGYPQGSDKLRQFTFSSLLFDEWAFWEQAQSAYAAAKPTLDGGGRLAGISSRSPGFFKKIVFDQLESQDLTFRETPPVPSKRPMEGVEIWKNPRNRFLVVDLHYTANPAKRSLEWRENIRSSMPSRDFAMEYEKSWQTFEGKPVYEDFKPTIHIVDNLKPEPGLPILLGWDFGLTPACLLCQLNGRHLMIFKEFVEANGSIKKLSPVVMTYLRTEFLPWLHGEQNITSYVDPAGFQRAQTDERTCVDIMKESGFRKVLPGPVVWETRKTGVEDFLIKIYKEGAAMQINSEGCPILIEGFNGGYRYPEKALEIEPTKVRPIKNKWSHPHDALQYVVSGATALHKQYKMDIQIPKYGFQIGVQDAKT